MRHSLELAVPHDSLLHHVNGDVLDPGAGLDHHVPPLVILVHAGPPMMEWLLSKNCSNPLSWVNLGLHHPQLLHGLHLEAALLLPGLGRQQGRGGDLPDSVDPPLSNTPCQNSRREMVMITSWVEAMSMCILLFFFIMLDLKNLLGSASRRL